MSSDIKICLLSLDRGAIIDPIVKDVIDGETFVILNKEDAVSSEKELSDIISKVKIETNAKRVWTMSCTTGQGVDSFIMQIVDILKAK